MSIIRYSLTSGQEVWDEAVNLLCWRSMCKECTGFIYLVSWPYPLCSSSCLGAWEQIAELFMCFPWRPLQALNFLLTGVCSMWADGGTCFDPLTWSLEARGGILWPVGAPSWLLLAVWCDSLDVFEWGKLVFNYFFLKCASVGITGFYKALNRSLSLYSKLHATPCNLF